MSKRKPFVLRERASFAEGMGRILDFGNTLTPRYPLVVTGSDRSLRRGTGRSGVVITGPGRSGVVIRELDRSAAATDREAAASDWATVGRDIRGAVTKITRGLDQNKHAKTGQRVSPDARRAVGAARSNARER